MKYCKEGDCLPVPEKYRGMCCKDCDANDKCPYTCDYYKGDDVCDHEIECQSKEEYYEILRRR